MYTRHYTHYTSITQETPASILSPSSTGATLCVFMKGSTAYCTPTHKQPTPLSRPVKVYFFCCDKKLVSPSPPICRNTGGVSPDEARWRHQRTAHVSVPIVELLVGYRPEFSRGYATVPASVPALAHFLPYTARSPTINEDTADRAVSQPVSSSL